MKQQMARMQQQEKYALDRTVSGRNTMKPINADKWNDDEIQHQMDEMKAMHRRLSTGSLSIDQIQQEAKEQMAAFRELAAPKRSPAASGAVSAVGTLSVTAPSRIPSKDDADYDLFLDVAPTIDGKAIPPKLGHAANGHHDDETPPITAPFHLNQHPISPQTVDIAATTTPNGDDTASRRSSYSLAGRRSLSHSASTSMVSQQMVKGADISQYTASGGGRSFGGSLAAAAPDGGTSCFAALRLSLRWYLGPLHRRESVLRLWFHGANAVLSMAVFVATASLLLLAVALTPFCGVGLLFLYALCQAVRHCVAADNRCCLYLGDAQWTPPMVTMAAPHSASMMGRLREYVGDPHTVSMALYFLFLKLPAAVVLSGSSLVMLSGVCSILMAPMVYWVDVDYFRSERYVV